MTRLRKPVYNGRPLSRSLHRKVPPEDQGEKWNDEKFATEICTVGVLLRSVSLSWSFATGFVAKVFVDEWTCIACRNCTRLRETWPNPASIQCDSLHGIWLVAKLEFPTERVHL